VVLSGTGKVSLEVRTVRNILDTMVTGKVLRVTGMTILGHRQQKMMGIFRIFVIEMKGKYR
jgi:hypothetical protein